MNTNLEVGQVPQFNITTASIWILLILLCNFFSGVSTQRGALLTPSASRVDMGGGTSDPAQIVVGLQAAPHFTDTLKWWSGPWVGGHVAPYYRPLTSVVWWLEYSAFGPYGLRGFQIVHAVLHIAVLLMVFGFIGYLTRDQTLAGITTCFFAAGFAGNFGVPSPIPALQLWHDGPELWTALAYIATCWAFVVHGRTGAAKWLAVACAFFVAAVLFKEMAYSLPFALAALLWYEGQWKQWRKIVPFVALALALFSWRWVALDGMGFRFGSNGAWPSRWILNVLGLGPYQTGNLAVPGLLAAILAIYSVRRKRWWYAGVLVGLTMGFLFITASALGVGIGDAVSLLLDDSQLLHNALALLFLFLVGTCLYTRQRTWLWAWMWVALTYVPLLRANATDHALYLVSIGWALWLAEPTAMVLRSDALQAAVAPVRERVEKNLRSRMRCQSQPV